MTRRMKTRTTRRDAFALRVAWLCAAWLCAWPSGCSGGDSATDVTTTYFAEAPTQKQTEGRLVAGQKDGVWKG